jgi:hypothetical protein
MSTKKSLIAIAAMALSLMGFASTATASTGVIRHVTAPNGIIPANTELHAVGWAKFSSSFGNFECHVTSNIKAVGANGTTGEVTSFNIPNTANCTGGGALAGCTLTSHTPTNLPWHATVTGPVAGGTTPAGDIDLTDAAGIIIHNKFSGGFFCPANLELKFANGITLVPLKTGATKITGGVNAVMGGTAALNDPIAGIEITGSGTSNLGNVTASGELELTAPGRCTWKIAAS